MMDSSENNAWWRVRFIVGNQVREYTEQDVGAALVKLVAEWGEVEQQHVHGVLHQVRLESVRRLG